MITLVKSRELTFHSYPKGEMVNVNHIEEHHVNHVNVELEI